MYLKMALLSNNTPSGVSANGTFPFGFLAKYYGYLASCGLTIMCSTSTLA